MQKTKTNKHKNCDKKIYIKPCKKYLKKTRISEEKKIDRDNFGRSVELLQTKHFEECREEPDGGLLIGV